LVGLGSRLESGPDKERRADRQEHTAGLSPMNRHVAPARFDLVNGPHVGRADRREPAHRLWNTDLNCG